MGRTHRTEQAGYEAIENYRKDVMMHVRNFYETRYPGIDFTFTASVKPSCNVIDILVKGPSGNFDVCVCGMRMYDAMREAWELKKTCFTFCIFSEEIVDPIFTITGDWRQNERLAESDYYYEEPIKFYDATSGNRLKSGMRLL